MMHHYPPMENVSLPPFLPRHPRWKPTVDAAPNCPRCDSTNTKFCYYNNYSLAQPRYFCKACRRYWTKGGSLRNVPVGGGCRKNRRGKPLRLSAPLSSSPSPDPPRPLHDPPHADIDLAVLYSRFLNSNPPAPGTAPLQTDEIPELLPPPWIPQVDTPLADLGFALDPAICDLDPIIVDEPLWQTSNPHAPFWTSPTPPPEMADEYLPGQSWCSTPVIFDPSGYDDLSTL